MAVGYKNLILIDNSKSMGQANFLLSKETAKYLCRNMEAQDLCRIAVFGEDIEYIDDYSQDAESLCADIDALELHDRDTYITDNLVSILAEWRDQDVACRNIILFTDGKENESLLHANEELYYMLSDLAYPVYVVQCVETRNVAPSKNLSAIATTSRGKLLLSEFEGSEGGSEKIMGDEILKKIDEGRKKAQEAQAQEAQAEEMEGADAKDLNEEEADAAKEPEETEPVYIESDKADARDGREDVTEYVKSTEAEETYASLTDPDVIVRNRESGSGIGFSVILPLTGVIFAVVFAIVIYFITHRRERQRRKDRKSLGRMGCERSWTDELEARIAVDAEDVDCTTFRLSDDECGTRLLEPEEGGYNIVLEDCLDPTRIYRAGGVGSFIIGRSRGLCDIVIDHDDSVSGRHCELSVVDGNWYVKDLNSSNGTRVNSQKVFQELMLKNGDILKLGQTALQVGI